MSRLRITHGRIPSAQWTISTPTWSAASLRPLRKLSRRAHQRLLKLCLAQSCGKCVPCRIGLGQLEVLIEQVLDRTATMETINIIERTAKVIADSAGCAIGYEAAHMVLKGIRGFREDYFPSPAILKEWLTMDAM